MANIKQITYLELILDMASEVKTIKEIRYADDTITFTDTVCNAATDLCNSRCRRQDEMEN